MNNSQTTLDWQDGQPFSVIYGDVYFARDSGLEETRHVFLVQNYLQQRWQELAKDQFTIVETGFGTGLNFLCAWQLWNQCAPPTARLNFVSTEKYPLSLADLTQALSLWPQLAEQCGQLLAQYRWLAPGWHRLVFEQGRVTLTLLIGDARDTLPQLRASVDAWFLDGFAPAKNPEMWQQGLFEQMARLSHASTSFATFTSAGEVRRGLQVAGFNVEKVAGFGRKREMLRGQYLVGARFIAPSQQRAIIIGGGIAGTATAHALAQRGWQVTLIERHSELAQEASGNPVGILYPRLSGLNTSGQDIALSRLALAGYLHTLRLLQRLGLSAPDSDSCGLLQLAFDARESIRCRAVAARGLPPEVVRLVEAAEASTIADIKLTCGGLYFPAAGWVNPPALCQALASHGNIKLLTSTKALKLQRNGDGWQVWDAETALVRAPVVIIAGANDTVSFSQSAHLPLESVRGQITLVPMTEASQRLRAIVCTDGYVSPQRNGLHCLGATFSPGDLSKEISRHDHAKNLAILRGLSPDLYGSFDEHFANRALQGRVAMRCATPDYLPMAGLVLDAEALKATPPRHTSDPSTLPRLDGLYVNTGHGSKGLINAPLCAEILASAICGGPAPVDSKLLAALDPNRFILRGMGLKRLIGGVTIG